MTSFEEAWSAGADIEGWLTQDQARWLFAAAGRVDPASVIVEIGSHHGRSTMFLAAGSSPETQIVAVDPYGDSRWGGGEEALASFERTLRERAIESRVRLIRGVGSAVGREWSGPPVGLLFVDGAHDYHTVLADFDSWRPHLAPEAEVFFHDAYSSPGVTRALLRRVYARRDFEYLGATRSLVRVRRSNGVGIAARLRGAVRMTLRLGWLVRNLAVKVAWARGWHAAMRALGHEEEGCPY